MVMSVDGEGPGGRAGLRQGDVVTGWNGHAIGGVDDLLRALGPDSVGSVVQLSASRGGAPMTFDVTIRARPER
jgi:S1-C subfamily serine protease